MSVISKKHLFAVAVYNLNNLPSVLATWDSTKSGNFTWEVCLTAMHPVTEEQVSTTVRNAYPKVLTHKVSITSAQNAREAMNKHLNAMEVSNSWMMFHTHSGMKFMKSGWDLEYRNVFNTYKLGICAAQLFITRKNVKTAPKLRCSCNLPEISDNFVAVTHEVVKKIGYLDPTHKHSFLNWFLRACLGNFNNQLHPVDLDHSLSYLRFGSVLPLQKIGANSEFFPRNPNESTKRVSYPERSNSSPALSQADIERVTKRIIKEDAISLLEPANKLTLCLCCEGDPGRTRNTIREMMSLYNGSYIDFICMESASDKLVYPLTTTNKFGYLIRTMLYKRKGSYSAAFAANFAYEFINEREFFCMWLNSYKPSCPQFTTKLIGLMNGSICDSNTVFSFPVKRKAVFGSDYTQTGEMLIVPSKMLLKMGGYPLGDDDKAYKKVLEKAKEQGASIVNALEIDPDFWIKDVPIKGKRNEFSVKVADRFTIVWNDLFCEKTYSAVHRKDFVVSSFSNEKVILKSDDIEIPVEGKDIRLPIQIAISMCINCGAKSLKLPKKIEPLLNDMKFIIEDDNNQTKIEFV